MKKVRFSLMIPFAFSFAFLIHANGQNNFTIHLEGLNEGDSATVIVQKSSEIYYKQLAVGNGTGLNTLNYNLEDGKWAINVDTKGYTFPPATAFSVPENTSAILVLTPMLNEDYHYTWQDDDSYVGHATQTYISEPSVITVLDKEVKVPNDYSSIELRNKFGIILSDDIEKWTIEDSYRIYQMFCNLPYGTYGEGSTVNPETGENIRGIIKLTSEEQYRDLTVSEENGIRIGVVSQAAFNYASPQIVTIDGIKGKFYSKRLYHAVVNFVSDFANNESVIDWIAQERFGVRFMLPNQETEDLMGEDASDFQEFFREEKIEILAMFEELPDGFHKQEGLKYLERRINGQPNPKYPTAAAIAWTGLNTIEFMEVAFNGSDLSAIRRLILHEKTHFLWAYTFDENLKKDWIEVGGWFEDPTSGSGWSTYNTTEFVSAYGHDNNPDEDMAESVAYYLENPDKLKAVSMRKFEFIRDRVMHGTMYVAQIREDLTFTVYNLFPDYVYPGKVKKIEVTVTGKPDEDKIVTIRATLHSINPAVDGAQWGYIRFASSSGTIHDLAYFGAENGNLDSVIVGTTTFSKYEKSGYWTMASFMICDQVGNRRYENTSTLGMKLYIENPLEDVIPPRWNYDLAMEVVEGSFSGSYFSVIPDVNGRKTKAIKASYSFYEDIPFGGSECNFILSTPDKPDYESYFWRSGGGAIIDSVRNYGNGLKSNKYIEAYLKIEEYMPSGYYSITAIGANDIASNTTVIEFVKDTSDFYFQKPGLYKDVRDSIYVKTSNPDYVKPEIDINNISVFAEPTNPTAPDGETKVNISLFARDLSDFIGKESGVYLVEFVLRNPVGNNFGYQTGNGTMYHPELDAYNTEPKPGSEWGLYTFNFLLPRGSVPGKWGIASASVTDKAGNKRNYSFVEYVRFDVTESDIVLEEPLAIEITDKLVNANNVDNIDISISCKPSTGLNYVYTIYSLMGGQVVRGEGIMTSDSMLIQGINTEGVLDGIIHLTVQLTDSASQLIATKTTEYDKDTERPSAYYTRTNLQDDGFSNLDSLIVEIVFDQPETGGTYDFMIEVSDLIDSTHITKTVLKSIITSNVITISDLNLKEFDNSLMRLAVMTTDTCFNEGEWIDRHYLILNDSIIRIDYANEKYSLELSSNSLILPSTNATNSSISIMGDTYWLAKTNEDWLSIDPISIHNGDGILTLVAENHKGNESRTAEVSVISVLGLQTLNIVQEANITSGNPTFGDDKLKLYPNPNNGQFFVELNNVEPGATITIYNMIGSKIYQASITDNKDQYFSIAGIDKGVYLVEIIDNGKIYSKKMIVN